MNRERQWMTYPDGITRPIGTVIDTEYPQREDDPFVSLIPIPGPWAEEQARIATLNRMSEYHGCDFLISYDWRDGQHEYCTEPEWDPFTNRCGLHSPDRGGWDSLIRP